jgi:hypothetical protein
MDVENAVKVIVPVVVPDDPQEFVEDDLAWSPVRAGALPERPEPLMVLLMSPKLVPISVETVTPEIRMA